MTGRQRVLAAMRREIPDRVPKTFSLCPSQMQTFKRRTNASDPAEHFGFEVRSVSAGPTRQVNDFSPWLGDTSLLRVDEWGVGWSTTESSFHSEMMRHPLQSAQSAADVEAYPFPDVDLSYRYEGIRDNVDALHDRGLAVAGNVSPLGGTIFWPAYKLRGMETLLMDLVDGSPVAEALLDRVTEISVAMARELAGCGVDIIHTADDLGTQKGLMIGKEMYRTWFKEPMRRVVDAAREVNPDILVFFHSDGNVEELIPEFIDVGIDILNPLQPECMDVRRIKRTYGRRLAFWGGVGTQTTMPFGTPEEVRRCVRELIEVVGRDGGLLIAPTHLLEPEVPWENITAFVDAVDEYGRY